SSSRDSVVDEGISLVTVDKTAPTVTNIEFIDSNANVFVDDADAVAGAVMIRFTFSEIMIDDNSLNPVIDLPATVDEDIPDTEGDLPPNLTLSNELWENNQQFKVTYSVIDNNDVVLGADILSVSGAEDRAGNPNDPAASILTDDLFSIDNAEPVITAPTDFALGDGVTLAGAIITYTATSLDNPDGPAVSDELVATHKIDCGDDFEIDAVDDLDSGDLFALGDNSVNCIATDGAGNSSLLAANCYLEIGQDNTTVCTGSFTITIGAQTNTATPAGFEPLAAFCGNSGVFVPVDLSVAGPFGPCEEIKAQNSAACGLFNAGAEFSDPSCGESELTNEWNVIFGSQVLDKVGTSFTGSVDINAVTKVIVEESSTVQSNPTTIGTLVVQHVFEPDVPITNIVTLQLEASAPTGPYNYEQTLTLIGAGDATVVSGTGVELLLSQLLRICLDLPTDGIEPGQCDIERVIFGGDELDSQEINTEGLTVLELIYAKVSDKLISQDKIPAGDDLLVITKFGPFNGPSDLTLVDDFRSSDDPTVDGIISSPKSKGDPCKSGASKTTGQGISGILDMKLPASNVRDLCNWSFFAWNTAPILDDATIDSLDVTLDIPFASTSSDCKFVELPDTAAGNPDTASASSLRALIVGGSVLPLAASETDDCLTSGVKTFTFGPGARTDFEDKLLFDYWGFGMRFEGDPEARGAVTKQVDLRPEENASGNPPTLEVAFTPNLVGHWGLESAASPITLDSSFAGNHATVNGGAVFTTLTDGKVGKALTFDNTDDYLTISPISFDGDFTFVTWLKRAASADDDELLGHTTSGQTQKIMLRGANAGLDEFKAFIRMTPGGPNVKADFGFTVGDLDQYRLFVLKRDSNEIPPVSNQIYISFNNGPFVAHGDPLPGTFTINTIGKTVSNQFWNGELDEVRLYKRALSQADVDKIFNIHKPVLYYDYEGNVIDNSNNGNDGGVNGGAIFTLEDTGRVGDALTFDNTDDTVTLNSGGPALDFEDDFTFVTWFKRAGSTDPVDALLGFDAAGQSQKIVFLGRNFPDGGGNPDKNKLFARMVGGSASVRADVGYTDSDNDSYQFLVVKRHNNLIEASLNNGAFTSLGVLPGTFTINTLGKPNDSQFWNGEIDETRLFDRALYDSEIADLFGATSPGLRGWEQ
ncbi:MAG: LamG-like jellyroll fold domain-containing protein, partial [Nitrososphaerales archaeon]